MSIHWQMNLASVLFAGVVLSAYPSPSLADEPADKELKQLDGTWKFISLKSDGEEAPAEFLRQARWIIRDKELNIPGAGGGKSSIKLDPSKSPKWFDLTSKEGPAKGKTAKAIYKLADGKLTICFPGGKQDADLSARPESFSGGPGMSLVVLEKSE